MNASNRTQRNCKRWKMKVKEIFSKRKYFVTQNDDLLYAKLTFRQTNSVSPKAPMKVGQQFVVSANWSNPPFIKCCELLWQAWVWKVS